MIWWLNSHLMQFVFSEGAANWQAGGSKTMRFTTAVVELDFVIPPSYNFCPSTVVQSVKFFKIYSCHLAPLSNSVFGVAMLTVLMLSHWLWWSLRLAIAVSWVWSFLSASLNPEVSHCWRASQALGWSSRCVRVYMSPNLKSQDLNTHLSSLQCQPISST